MVTTRDCGGLDISKSRYIVSAILNVVCLTPLFKCCVLFVAQLNPR